MEANKREHTMVCKIILSTQKFKIIFNYLSHLYCFQIVLKTKQCVRYLNIFLTSTFFARL